MQVYHSPLQSILTSEAQSPAPRRRQTLYGQASLLALRTAIGIAAIAGSSLLMPAEARAECVKVYIDVSCSTTITTNTPGPNNRSNLGNPSQLTHFWVSAGAEISGYGIAARAQTSDGLWFNNNGSIIVDSGNAPTEGGTAALNLRAGAGNIFYKGSGDISNFGSGEGLSVWPTYLGFTSLAIGGNVFSNDSHGVDVRGESSSGDIYIRTRDVTAQSNNSHAIYVSSKSTYGDVSVVANGDLLGGATGVYARLADYSSTGDVKVTTNGAVDGEIGVRTSNLGTGSTFITTIGDVTARTTGISAFAEMGDVTISAGSVTSSNDTAILARTEPGYGGTISITTGAVSGKTGIATSSAGATSINTLGPVTGTIGSGMFLTGYGGGIAVNTAQTVSGREWGLYLTSVSGDISVTGTGGFIGGIGAGIEIMKIDPGSVTVDVSGDTGSADYHGIVVRDTAAGGAISLTTGAVTAEKAGMSAINVRSLSLAGDLTVVANGNLLGGYAGVTANLINGTSTGDVKVTANGAIDGDIGVWATNSGSGSNLITTIGDVTARSFGIYSSAKTGDITVNTGAVTTSNGQAILALTDLDVGGAISVTTGKVSGTAGVTAWGGGAVNINTTGPVNGTAGSGISANGGGAVTINAAQSVTGAGNGLELRGGRGGSGDISVTGTGDFIGGVGAGIDIVNYGSGTVTVDVSGDTGSADHHGILVRNSALGGAVSVTTGAVTAEKAGMYAINALSLSQAGDLTVVANGNLLGGFGGVDARLLSGTSTGDIKVTANGAIDGDLGVFAVNSGSGSTFVTTIGDVTARSFGIYGSAKTGDVTVNTGDVTSSDYVAVQAETDFGGDGAISITTGSATGATGILAYGGGPISINTLGPVTGTTHSGMQLEGADAVAVTAAQTVTGGHTALYLKGGAGGAGDISVTGTGSFVGGTGAGINILNNGSGTVTVDISGDTRSADYHGIYVRDTAAGGAISVTTGAVTALAANMRAIDVRSLSQAGDLTIVANGDIRAGEVGVYGTILNGASTGNVNVTSNSAVEAMHGVYAENFGSGSTRVSFTGPVTASGTGIQAWSRVGDVTVNAGPVTSFGDTAIKAYAGAGEILINANGPVTGRVQNGIIASGNGAVSVNAAQSVTGAVSGLYLRGGFAGAGDISVTGTGSFVGGTGAGLDIQNNGSGSVTVDISGDTRSADYHGIVVRDTIAGGAISVTTGAVTAEKAGMQAIALSSQILDGDVTVVANGDIRGGAGGIMASLIKADAKGDLSVAANGAVQAQFGVYAENYGLGATALTTVGPVTTSGLGLYAASAGGDIAVNTGSVLSSGSTAIVAYQKNVGSNGSITVSSGLVSGTNGILANNAGYGSVTINASGPVMGTAGEAVSGRAAGGNIDITVGSATAVGASAVTALNTLAGASTGTISVTQNAGGVITSDTAGTAGIHTDSSQSVGATKIVANGVVNGVAAGVRAQSAMGNITVQTGATGNIYGQTGVDLRTRDGALSVTNAGNILGSNGVTMQALGSGSGTITNSGTITGANAVTAGFRSGTFSLNNTGTLNGALYITGSQVAGSRVTNAASGKLNFGSGVSMVSAGFTNDGVASIGQGGFVTFLGDSINAGQINLGGGASFFTNGAMSNPGLINAWNGQTTDRIAVGGDYSGAGRLVFDYNLAARTSDQMIISGRASGTTGVTLKRVGEFALLPGGFLPIVTAAGGAQTGAFASDGDLVRVGFIIESFAQNPLNANQFGLLQSVNPATASLASMSAMAKAASALIDEPINAYVSREVGSEANQVVWGAWGRGGIDRSKQALTTTISGAGLGFTDSSDMRRDNELFQVGADFGLLNINASGWSAHFGGTVGKFSSDPVGTSTDRLSMDATFAGAYALLTNGRLTLDGTLRREWREFEVNSPLLFGNGTPKVVDGEAIAGSINAAYLMGGETGWRATPFVGFDYAEGDIDDLRLDASTVYSPGDDHTKMGEAGLRISYRTQTDGQWTVEPFLGFSVLKNWSDTDNATFTLSAPGPVMFQQETSSWDSATRYSIGLTAGSKDGRYTGFVVGTFNNGTQIESDSVNLGLRINF